MRATTLLSIGLGMLAAGATPGRAVELARIQGMGINEIESRRFSLDREEEVEIEAVTLRPGRLATGCDAWILDASTREVVWRVKEADTERKGSRLLEVEDRKRLPKGEYELYLATFPDRDRGGFGLKEFFGLVTRGHRYWHGARRLVDDLEITLRAPSGTAQGRNRLHHVAEALGEGAIASMIGMGDGERRCSAFVLPEKTEVEIYALGEATGDGLYDAAWIIDVDTGEKVWALERRNSKRAGGDKKNRLVREKLDLPAGRYAAFYATDDSHAWPRFNLRPPFDPMAWGLTIRTTDPARARRVTEFDYEGHEDRNRVVDLTRIRDHRHAMAGFTLDRPQELCIHAVGEGDHGDMYDYGWIIDARSREVVWEMKHRHTRHAGGAKKNRVANRVKRFDAGSYTVHFVTDDSHAYRDWNAAPPFEPTRWGITLTGVGEDFDQEAVRPYRPDEDPDVLARIARVRNREWEQTSFRIDHDQDVLVYALGEGRRGDMYDYAWIENDRGRTVWEMTYRKTDHAGGSKKNRLFRDEVHLKAGTYEVYYISDGSHAYGRWNAEPPRDPEAWGVMVLAVD